MKLSIITINYNNLAGLKKTVDSVLSQTWRDFEWIIVDGGSTDGSKEYIETLAQSLSKGTAIDSVQWYVEHFSLPGFTAENLKEQQLEETLEYSSSIDNRPSPINHRQSSIANRQSPIDNSSQRFLWCSEPDKGVYNAMNKGIAVAHGEYLNFMNSGDCFYSLETLEKVFKEAFISDIIYGDWIQVYEDHINKEHFSDIAGIYSLEKKNICQQSIFVKTIILQSKGFDESYRLYADWKRWIQCALEFRSFHYVPFVVCYYDMSGISSSDSGCSAEKERIRNEVYSHMIRNTCNALDYYNNTRSLVRLRALLDRGGLPADIMKSILKIFDYIFCKIDFKKNAIVGEKNCRK